MKKGIIVYMLLFTCNISFGQTLVDTTKRWNNHWGSSIFGQGSGTEFIRFGNDTTVDANIYKKVLRATHEAPSNWSSYGLIRESAEKKIYYRTDTSNQEYLLYDFSLNINDTVLAVMMGSYNSGLNLFLGSELVFVLSIDSILIGNKYQKQLHMATVCSGVERDQWVEGMGGSAGMLHNDFGYVGGDFYELVCFYQNDSLFYLNPSYAYCYVKPTSIPENCPENFISISPNPVTDISVVSIKNSSEKSLNLEIFNTSGEKIIVMDVKDDTYIDRKNFAPGIYFFKFTTNSGAIRIIKVIIL
jgi:hypothetical protein